MWSLHVEEQFYLIFPFLVLYLTRAHWAPTQHFAPVIRLTLHGRFRLCCCFSMLLPAAWIHSLWEDWSRFTGPTPKWSPDKIHLVASLGILMLAARRRLAGGSFITPVERTVGYSLFDFAFVGFMISVLAPWKRNHCLVELEVYLHIGMISGLIYFSFQLWG